MKTRFTKNNKKRNFQIIVIEISGPYYKCTEKTITAVRSRQSKNQKNEKTNNNSKFEGDEMLKTQKTCIAERMKNLSKWQ